MMTEKEAWLHIAEAYDKPRLEGEHITLCGLCYARLYVDVDVETQYSMMERIQKYLVLHNLGTYAVISDGPIYGEDERPFRARIARQFAEECE